LNIPAISHFQNNFHSITEIVRNHVPDKRKPAEVKDLLPVVAGVAAACLLSPAFAIGAATVAITLPLEITAAISMNRLGLFKDDPDSKYHKLIVKHPYYATVFAPILEEIAFRGIILNAIKVVATQVLPAITITCLIGPPMHIAVAVSIAASAILFGAAHLRNSHKNVIPQSIMCAISGIAFGILFVQYGLLASIGAHIVNNTVITGVLLAGEKNKTKSPVSLPLPSH
jgi:membrane protease YdiL (CAAX protease family)